MQVKDKLISNTAYNFLNWVSITIVPMFFWLIIGKTLPPASYGIVATSLQITILLSAMALLGFDAAMQKLIPELLERGKKDKIQGLILFSLTSVSVLSLVITVALILFSSQLATLLKLEPTIICVIAFSFILSTFGNFFRNIDYGFQNMKKIFLTNFLGQVSKVIITLILIFLGFTYFGALIGLLFSLLIILIARFDKSLFHISKKITMDRKLIFKYSVPYFITVIFWTLFNNTQYIILTALKTVEISGLFAIAMTMASAISAIPGILSSALFPIISGLSADRDGKQKQLYLLKLVFRYSLFFVLPITAFLIIFSKHIVLFFSKPEYLSSIKFLPLLATSQISLGLGTLFLSSLYAIGKPKKQMGGWIATALIYVFLAIPLTYYFSGIGLTISYFVSTIALLLLGFILIKKYLTFKLPMKDLGRIISGVLVSSLFLIFVSQYITTLIVAGIFVVLAGLIYLLVLLKLNFYLEEDLKVLDFMTGRLPLFNKQISQLREYLSNFVSRSYR